MQRALANKGAAEIGEMLGHGKNDQGRTAIGHYIGQAERVPALHVIAGGKQDAQADKAEG